ncbi:hypothetical protein GENT5_06260 [Flavobacterium ammoniigenes]|jgi:steroid delta-isomerase-like uncharacterized protein|uniref:SnoaL-like polyketide cyclase n=1 Tax=Flavobacterium ammoniigenes TaxID=1751095 RepID=A0ABM7V454_9FLAO|nr:ester cyclase [Flavobacterium ammoniigenes]BDB54321.1 hypothetical protein GENT5_06260 [Flavobacterium ammoniigenes]
MKKILVLIAISVTLFACKSEADKNEKIAQDNIKFYSKVWDEVINEGKIAVLDTAYAPDVVLHTVPETKGAANAKAYYANYVTGFSDREFTVKETFAQGNKLTKYWVFKGKHTGDFFGIPATGKTISVEGCTIATIINGKITEERDFFDNLEFLRQLGLMPR